MKLNPAKCSFKVGSGKFHGFMVTKKRIEANSSQLDGVINILILENKKDIQCLTKRIAALNRFLSRSFEYLKPLFLLLQKSTNFNSSSYFNSSSS